MGAIDITVLVIYVLGVTAFGVWFYKRASTPEGFTAANRRLPGWAVGLSIFGTYLSSISFVGLPGKAYGGNWNFFVFSLSLPLAAWVAVRWFVPLYRARGDISAYAYLEARFGIWARLYAMTFYLLSQLVRMGAVMYFVALALTGLTGWDIKSIIIVSGVLITFYTIIGGIEAVIWTDVVQSIILTVGAAVCVLILIFGMPAGPAQIFEIAAASDKFSLGSFSLIFVQPTFWVVMLYGIVMNLQNFGIDQSFIQRYHTARDLAAARRSVWIGALAYLPISALFFFIGTALFAYYQAGAAVVPADLRADQVFPHFIVNSLPVGVTGLLIAALTAAAMSSIDTSMNSSATILLSDVYKRLLRPDASEATQMRFLRLTTLALGVAGTATALFFTSYKDAFDAWWELAGVFSGGMVGLFLLAAFSRRARAPQAIAAMVTGLLVIAWATLSPKSEFFLEAGLANAFHSFMTAVIGTVTIFIVGVLLSRMNARGARKTPPETIFDLD